MPRLRRGGSSAVFAVTMIRIAAESLGKPGVYILMTMADKLQYASQG